MSWKLSRYRVGELVEVRGEQEILDTLDQNGCLAAMPFMPEMLQYCGQRFRVCAVAHKTCDTAHKTWKGRRLQSTVHLEGLSCDGSAHGGCEAECNLFWKDDWLKPVGVAGHEAGNLATDSNAATPKCTEAVLRASVQRSSPSQGDEPTYRCQATELYDATQPLAWWNLRQYVFDVVTGNRPAGYVLRVLFLASLRRILPRMPIGYRYLIRFNEWIHLRLSGRPAPSLHGQVRDGVATPTAKLDLVPGEYVRIKPQTAIEQTINKAGRNRGLSFDPEEMASYCGRVARVRKRVARIVDEYTGKMLQMKEPCIILDGVVCRAEYASCRLNCPRAIPAYWREIWLERVDQNMIPEKTPG
jgi:hypothetical protein